MGSIKDIDTMDLEDKMMFLETRFCKAVVSVNQRANKKELLGTYCCVLCKTTYIDYDIFDKETIEQLYQLTSNAFHDLCGELIKTRPYVSKYTQETLGELLTEYQSQLMYFENLKTKTTENWHYTYFMVVLLETVSVILGLRNIIISEMRYVKTRNPFKWLHLQYLKRQLFI